MQSDLSSAKESVIKLSLLLFQIDPFLEVGISDDLLQGGSDLRNQASQNRRVDVLELTATCKNRPLW